MFPLKIKKLSRISFSMDMVEMIDLLIKTKRNLFSVSETIPPVSTMCKHCSES